MRHCKLSVHLGAEDNALYHRLLNSLDENARAMAKSFVDEMGGEEGSMVKVENIRLVSSGHRLYLFLLIVLHCLGCSV